MPGGNANAYAYALDPINFADLSGMSSCAILCVTLGPGGQATMTTRYPGTVKCLTVADSK